MARLLVVEGIHATYEKGDLLKPVKPEDDVLRSVNCIINEREVVALVGESGSGKSTLARVIAGCYLPDWARSLTGAKHCPRACDGAMSSSCVRCRSSSSTPI